MKQIVYRSLGLSAVLVLLALGAGCATTGDVDAAKQMAQQAKDAADQANRTAQEAKDEAAAAKAAAEAAQRSAEEAKAAARATNQKIDRAFKKSVQK